MVGSDSCTLDVVVVVVVVIATVAVVIATDVVVLTKQSSASNDSNVVGQLGSIFRISRFTATDGADCIQVLIICMHNIISICY